MFSQTQIRSALNNFLAINGLSVEAPHVILAGGAMALQGLDREIRDIDIWVPGLPCKLEVVIDGVEFDAKPGFDLGDPIWRRGVWGRRVRLESGLEVMSLHDVLEMKLCLNRDKDQSDIKALAKCLAGIDIDIEETRWFARMYFALGSSSSRRRSLSACGRCWGDGCSDCGGLGYE